MNDCQDSFEDVFARYVDRLNAGEGLDKERLRIENPDMAGRLLEELEAYEHFGGELEADEPLGTLGDYTLRRQIGRGGMGVVYEAWQGSMDRVVALKVLPAAVAADEKAFTRFMREAKIAGKLDHQNVVPVHAAGFDENVPYYAMEYVEGETLAQVLARVKEAEPETKTPFGPKDDIRYFGQLAAAFADVADGLQHAHSKGVVHRDIKPSNLILDGDGRLRILDFGLARLEGQESLTLSGDVVGTPLYMSPEQARRRKIPVDHRTDVYSLGATMYQAVCGRPPFRGKDHAETLSQIVDSDPVEPRKLNPRVPKDFDTIVLKCLRKDASDRYGTAEALAQDLRRFVRGEAVEARPEVKWERVRRRLWRSRRLVAGAALLAVLFAGLFFAVLYAHRAERQQSLAQYRLIVREAAARLAAARLRITGRYDRWSHPVPGVLLEPRALLRSPHRESGVSQEVARITEDLEEATRLVPDGRDAHYHLACAYHVAGDLARAREALEQVRRLDPDFAPGLYLLATIRKEPIVAVSDRDVAGEFHPDWWDAWLGTRLPEIEGDNFKDWEGVANAYDHLIGESLEPYLGFTLEAYLGRGIAHLAMRDLVSAERDFAVAHYLLPRSLEPEVLLAQTYAIGGRFDAARDVLDHARTRFMDRGKLQEQEAALEAIALHAWFGDYREALPWTDLIPDEFPRSRLRSRLLNLLSEFDRAASEAQDIVREFPNEALAWEILASTLVDRLDATQVPDPEIILRALRACDRGLQVATKRRRIESLLSRAVAWGRRGLSLVAEESSVPSDPWKALEQSFGITGQDVRGIHEDFTADPDPFDGAPLLWEVVPRREEHVTSVPGHGLRLDHRSHDPHARLRLYSDRAWAGDLTMRAKVSYSGDQGGPWLFCHLGRRSHYVAGIQRWSPDEIVVFFERFDPGGVARKEIAPLRFDPATGEAFFLELLITGDHVEVRTWPVARVRPEAPQLEVEDATYRSGKFGIGYDGDAELHVRGLSIAPRTAD